MIFMKKNFKYLISFIYSIIFYLSKSDSDFWVSSLVLFFVYSKARAFIKNRVGNFYRLSLNFKLFQAKLIQILVLASDNFSIIQKNFNTTFCPLISYNLPSFSQIQEIFFVNHNHLFSNLIKHYYLFIPILFEAQK